MVNQPGAIIFVFTLKGIYSERIVILYKFVISLMHFVALVNAVGSTLSQFQLNGQNFSKMTGVIEIG